jgi:hypothetical protein
MASCVFSTGPYAAKWSYFVGFVLTTVLMWLLRDYGHHVVGHSGPLSLCKEEPSSSSAAACMGKGAVMRISWGNCIFFGLHLLALLGVSREENPRLHAHTCCLPLQFMAWAVLIGSSFAIPNHVFFIWGQVGGLSQRKYDSSREGALFMNAVPKMCCQTKRTTHCFRAQGPTMLKPCKQGYRGYCPHTSLLLCLFAPFPLKGPSEAAYSVSYVGQ